MLSTSIVKVARLHLALGYSIDTAILGHLVFRKHEFLIEYVIPAYRMSLKPS